MANDKTTLRFWLRTDRPNRDGSSPIHLVYQVRGDKRLYAVPGVKLFPANWNVKEQAAIYISKSTAEKLKAAKLIPQNFDYKRLFSQSQIDQVNLDILAVRNDVRKIEDRLRDDGIAITTDIIDKLKEQKKPETEKKQPGKNIVDFIQKFINETTDHKLGTIKEYRGLANKMKEYESIKKTKFTFEGDASILKGFSTFLTDTREINNITKAKLFSTFKTILRYAKANPYKYKVNLDYLEYKDKSIKRNERMIMNIALTRQELDAIYSLDLTGKRSLDEARDIFCFACATSMRYGDLVQFERRHIKGSLIVIPASDKNQKPLRIPLLPMSRAILQKYADRPRPLPTTGKQRLISNQPLNRLIKKIGEMAGVNTEIEKIRMYGLQPVSLGIFPKYKLLSIHTGRKTWITLSLAGRMPILDVMAVTSHSSISVIKKSYDDVTDERIIASANETWELLPKSKLRAVK